MRVLAQLDRTFILASDGEALILVDQHAAHERIAYESIVVAARRRAASEPLLVPLVVELDAGRERGARPHDRFAARRRARDRALRRAYVSIVATPFGYGARAFDLTGFLDDLSEDPKQRDVRERVWASLACHSVTVAGEPLEPDEMTTLVERLQTCENPMHCPHGRPTMVRLRSDEIARMFKRVLAAVSDVLILAGPTASGKTELAVELAREFDAEIVGADSRQIYRDMPIGTAAPSPAQLAEVPHHLVAFLDPRERYSAARYAADALDALADIRRRGKRAIVAGGTGFYIRALTGGVALAPQYDEALRGRLAREVQLHPPEFLHDWLARRDPARARALSANDTYRVIRALEIALAEPAAIVREDPVRTLGDAGFGWQLVFLDVPWQRRRRADRAANRGDAGTRPRRRGRAFGKRGGRRDGRRLSASVCLSARMVDTTASCVRRWSARRGATPAVSARGFATNLRRFGPNRPACER